MDIDKNCVVSFHYALSENGTPLESSENADPMACLIGANNIIPGLEEALMGRSSGDEFSVTVPPEKAYGERKPNLLTRVSAKHLGVDARKLKPGMVLRIQTKRGPQMMRVIKAGRFMVNLDANHPMAGLTLTFDITVQDVRQATEEEIKHGHAHGPGGHDHGDSAEQ
ncbi:MAG: peptidylprolyl isomerase [Lysobacterales bacterium]